MNYSNVVILLARQRSGTNALRSVLSAHPDIYCHNEVFNLADIDTDEDRVLREANFFNFQEKYARGDVRRLLPSNHERLFLDFLEYLRCFSSKRYMLIDVTPDRVEAQWHFVDTLLRPSDGVRLGGAWIVRRGGHIPEPVEALAERLPAASSG